MSKLKKTNAMRILEKNRIDYQIYSYDIDDDNFDGVEVSKKIGLDSSEVFKTLVTFGSGQYIVCIIPVNQKLDLKVLATNANIKKLEMIPVNDILAVTGYVRGGCSPVGMKKEYPAFIDSSALDKTRIAVSAGVRGQQLYLKPKDLINICRITSGEFSSNITNI